MKKAGCLFIVAWIVCSVFATDTEQKAKVVAAVQTVGAGMAEVTCDDAGSWKFSVTSSLDSGRDVVTVKIESPVETEPPKFGVMFRVSGAGVQNVWVSAFDRDGYHLWPQLWWKGLARYNSQLACDTPIAVGFNSVEKAPVALACSDAFHPIAFGLYADDRTCEIVGRCEFFQQSAAKMKTYTCSVMMDRRNKCFAETVRDCTRWIAEQNGFTEATVPDAAFEPLYSTWYAYLQDVSAMELETEAFEAASLGMKTMILDDGWQKVESAAFYSATGDWMPVPSRFPDMKAHVAAVHKAGLKYMLWLAVPYVGDESKAWVRFKDKVLFTRGVRSPGKVAVLDPRFPEVREYLIRTYERVVGEWDFDGVKLDFIDQFIQPKDDPAAKDGFAGRDCRSVPEAVDRLMKDVLTRLRAIKPDVLVEFRQHYMGPAILQYGNMMRVADCPADPTANRKRMCDLRLTSGGIAVHSDMLVWSNDETPEGAALPILNVLYSTIQYSMVLKKINPAHRDVIRHWLAFSQRHRDALLKGTFAPHHAENGYTWIEAENASERIVTSYAENACVNVGKPSMVSYVINATGTDSVIVETSTSRMAELFNTMGERTGTVRIESGVSRIHVPVSGYARLDPKVISTVQDTKVETHTRSNKPETWFHIIGGNASKEGLAADIAAVAEAGISGIQLFHGGGDGTALWPGVTNGIPCMSENWVELIRFAETECHRHGLKFKMQNCPGWSMSGGPWITPDRAMRKFVCFEPGKMPQFDADDDYHEIGEVEFPVEAEDSSVVRSVTIPAPSDLCYYWCYEPDIVFEVWSHGRKALERECPAGNWADSSCGPGLEMTFDVGALPRDGLELRARNVHDMKPFEPVWSSEHRLDNWQAKAGRTLRQFKISTNAAPIHATEMKRLVFGHVNMKRRNHPAPPEATGWECDKMDPRGFEANFAGYIGRLLKAGVKVDGILVDSWECGSQSWTWKMEDEFERRAGYALRPWLPALFGYIIGSEVETERFLLDWRNVCSRLVEENYYGTIARLAREHGMSVVYETAFGDVIPGDIMRFWKYADEAMCEFWNPHDNNGFVGSFDFKPILPCASAAHIYRKRRVSAEAFTSFELTFDENFKDWKKVQDEHYARGVTHVVYNTFTHNPVIGGKPPSSSYGDAIGSPFLREQTWWPYLKHFSKYIERCGRELERGVPAVDILMYLGDDVNHKPSESKLLFGNRYKYDYLNNDVLMNALDVADGRLVVGACPGCEPQTDSPTYRVLWIPKGTFLLPATEAKIAALAAKGARVVRGDFEPDWPSPVKAMLGVEPSGLRGWYQRRDGDEDIFFIVEANGRSLFHRVKNGVCMVLDPVTGKASASGRAECPQPAAMPIQVELKPV
ncbi:MAG: alpha-galactosidase, partial [Kiritimatiellae bacterium]|nr:alpha-galactosidase [Kiritimatiellia bacterium]